VSGPNAAAAYAALDAARGAGRLNMKSWAFGRADLIGLPELTDTEACGTTACLAGWGTALAGYQIDGDGYVYRGGVFVGGHVQDFAARLFGISGSEAARLFHVGNADLDEAMAEVFGPRPDYGTGCRCDWLGVGTPEHAPSPLCRSLRPDADRDDGPIVDANGDPVPDADPTDDTLRAWMAGRVPADCGHYIAASEARAGFRGCERCPEPGGAS
jgi:hypothetical protein